MPGSTPVPHAAANGPPASQPSSSNQVRGADAINRHREHQQPPVPRRSSSLLPALRRRASEPLPQSLRERYTHKPGDTHTRYTYGAAQRRSGYQFGFSHQDVEYDDDIIVRKPVSSYHFLPHSQTLGGLHSPNLNSYDYRYRGRRSPADLESRYFLDNYRSQGSSYTDNIRAMAGQMYGEPPERSRVPFRTQRNRNTHHSLDRYMTDTHSYNYAHDRALTRHHHLRLSGGL